jgi:DNA-binding FrmR family transcriptional regulator
LNECCAEKKKLRDEDEKRPLRNRLSRIEGQIRGLRKMIDGDAYCTDVLTQVSSVRAALDAFSRELLSSHIRECVVGDIRSGDDSVVDDLIKTLQIMMK